MIKEKLQNIKSSHQANLENQGSDNLQQGWEIKKLGEVCKVIAGQSPEGKFYNSKGIGMPFYQGKKEFSEKYIGEPTTWTTKITKEAEAGDVLMSVRAPVGPVNFSTQKICIGRGLAAIRAGKNIDKEFLYNFLIKHENEIEGNAGAVFNSINKTQIEAIAIPLPPLHEQQRIVSILDEAFAAIAKAKANAEQNLKNAKELFESYLQEVFDPSTRSGQGKKGDGWEVRTLGELCVFTQGIQRDVKLQSETKGENQVRFLRIVDYTQGNEPPRYIDFPGEKYILNTDDVALVRYGASTGFVCRGLEGALANNLFRVIPKSTGKLTNDFLFIFLRSPLFQNAIKATMNGAAMPAISFSLIEGIPFPLPPLKEQQTIVRQLDALRAETQKLEAIYQKKIDNLEELKKSILQKAFSGELSGGEPV